jgi:hypothetical protein
MQNKQSGDRRQTRFGFRSLSVHIYTFFVVQVANTLLQKERDIPLSCSIFKAANLHPLVGRWLSFVRQTFTLSLFSNTFGRPFHGNRVSTSYFHESPRSTNRCFTFGHLGHRGCDTCTLVTLGPVQL